MAGSPDMHIQGRTRYQGLYMMRVRCRAALKRRTHAEDVLEGGAVHGRRQDHLSAQHRREAQRRDMRVVLVDEPGAGDVPQQQPQPPADAPLRQVDTRQK